ncbi:Uncharacterised protein [Mycolicibacterium thermoresistibile]|jgi:hypothetical protein|nr:hypothetical protein [Mycolicibacterium thermoresistibile]GAT14832.1 putative uncharacterized protein [Mycolicibacterium thermoresistibile]SNW20056.1 Uncharacterised protein [Mycolicibacterium thermoresistibile]
MKQWGLCAGAIVAGGMLAIGGAATAAAVPAVVGQPYADAAQAIEDAGGTPRVASRVGTQLSDDECIVTNAWEASFVRDAGDEFVPDDGEVMVALNCNGARATATDPGASVLSPEGRAAKQAEEARAALAAASESAE